MRIRPRFQWFPGYAATSARLARAAFSEAGRTTISALVHPSVRHIANCDSAAQAYIDACYPGSRRLRTRTTERVRASQ